MGANGRWWSAADRLLSWPLALTGQTLDGSEEFLVDSFFSELKSWILVEPKRCSQMCSQCGQFCSQPCIQLCRSQSFSPLLAQAQCLKHSKIQQLEATCSKIGILYHSGFAELEQILTSFRLGRVTY